MIPHIVFANGVDGYFPGPGRWECGTLAAHAPSGTQTSGITQPPVHAIAVQRILDHSRRHGRSTRAVAEEFLDRRWPDLVRWHRWLAHARDLDGNGRIALYHGWESGMDNSPRWDRSYANVVAGVMPDVSARGSIPRRRHRTAAVQRRIRPLPVAARGDEDASATTTRNWPTAMSFAVEDVFVSADLLDGVRGARDHRRGTLDAELPTSGTCTGGPTGSGRASSPPPTNGPGRHAISICAADGGSPPKRSPCSRPCCAAACQPRRRTRPAPHVRGTEILRPP